MVSGQRNHNDDYERQDTPLEAGQTYSIGDLSKEFGVTLRSLRFYEDKELLFPQREGARRIYSRRDRARLKLILMGKRVGFSLTEIREMLDLYDLKDGRVKQLRVSLRKFEEQLDHLKSQRDEIDRAINELTRTRDVVRGILKEKEAAEAGN